MGELCMRNKPRHRIRNSQAEQVRLELHRLVVANLTLLLLFFQIQLTRRQCDQIFSEKLRQKAEKIASNTLFPKKSFLSRA